MTQKGLFGKLDDDNSIKLTTAKALDDKVRQIRQVMVFTIELAKKEFDNLVPSTNKLKEYFAMMEKCHDRYERFFDNDFNDYINAERENDKQ